MSAQSINDQIRHCPAFIRIGRLVLLMVLMGVSGSCVAVENKVDAVITVNWPAEWGQPEKVNDVEKSNCSLGASPWHCKFKNLNGQTFSLIFKEIKRKAEIKMSASITTLKKEDLTELDDNTDKSTSRSFSISFSEKYYRVLRGHKENVDILTIDHEKCRDKILYDNERKVSFSGCSNVQRTGSINFILRLKGYNDRSIRMSDFTENQIDELKLIPIYPNNVGNITQDSRKINLPQSDYDELKSKHQLESVKFLQEIDYIPCEKREQDDKGHVITFSECNFKYESDGTTLFYLEVPGKERTKTFPLKNFLPERNYSGLWSDKVSSNSTANTGSVLIQLPHQLYEALKNNLNKVKLYTEANSDKTYCNIRTKNDAERKVIFPECPDTQPLNSTSFSLDISGFEPISLYPVKNIYKEEDIFGENNYIRTKPIKIGKESKTLTLNQIGTRQFLNPSETLCKQSYTVSFEYVFNLGPTSEPVNIDTGNKCHTINVRWQTSWGKPDIAKENSSDTQELDCDSSRYQGKQSCNYITKASDHFILEWQGGLISTQVDLNKSFDTYDVHSLSIRFPTDIEEILNEHTSQNKNASLCEQEPSFKLDSIKIYDYYNNPISLVLNESRPMWFKAFDWNEASLPTEIKGTFVQTTKSPKYAQSLEKVISMRTPYTLPKKTELLEPNPKQIPVEIEFDPPDQKTPYSEKREFLLFASEQDCNNTENIKMNVFYTESETGKLTLPECQTDWAKITGEGKKTAFTKCALGTNTFTREPKLLFKLKATPGYGDKRWLIVVSETKVLAEKRDVIIDALKAFLNKNAKQPITIIASGAHMRRLLRTEDLANDSGENKLKASINMNNTIQNAILDLAGIESEISLDKIKKMLYITDSTGLDPKDELNRNQKQIMGLLKIEGFPITVVTHKESCEIWTNQAQVGQCFGISNVNSALDKFEGK